MDDAVPLSVGFLQFMESAPDAIVCVDATGGIVLVNTQAESMFGYSRTELLGRTVETLIPARFHAAHEGHRAGYMEDPHVRPMGAGRELMALRKDGSEFPVEISLSPVTTAEGEIAVAAIRDVTDRKKQAAELAEAQALLANIMKSSTRHSIIGKDLDRNILSWNEGARRMYGYEADEVIGRSSNMLHRPEDLENGEVQAFHERALRDGSVDTLFERVRKDGTTFTAHATLSARYDEDGEPIGFLIISHDVSDVKRAEQRFKGILDSTPDAMVIVDETGSMVLVNAQAEATFGYSKEELLGQKVETLIPERFHAVHPGHRSGFFASPKARAMGSGLDLFAQRKDGSEFPVEISLNPIETDEGRLVAAAVRDVSERKEMEAQAAEARLAEQELKHMRDLDEFRTRFINSAAHELFTPLTPISATLRLLRDGVLDEEKQEKAFDILERSFSRLSRLVGDLLEAARFQSGRLKLVMADFDLAEAVRHVTDTYVEDVKEKGLEFTVDVPDQLPYHGDEQRITQVLYNLLSNALKFTESGEVSLRMTSDDETVEIAVTDDGVGLDADQIGRLFQPFVRMHEDSAPGTGLGLYISAGLMEAHGGRIGATSDGPGKGATFTIALPRRASA